LIAESEGMIVKVPALINMYTNFFMAHHGSKCTSDRSEKFNNLRERFLDKLKELGYDWYTMGWSEFGDGETSHGSFANPDKGCWISPSDENYMTKNIKEIEGKS